MLSEIINSHWYAINTKPNQEQRVLLNLISGGIETFNPKIKSYRVNDFTGKKTFFKKNLFPSYIFAKFDLSKDYNKVRFTRGLQSIVSLGGKPCIVDDDIIELLKTNADADGFITFEKKLHPGDKVIIQKPYLKDFTGVFVRELSDNSRIQILLSTVTYQLNLIVDKNFVVKA